LWELAYAPSLGHPAQLAGRKEAVRHATWFVGAVENFRFFDLNIYALADVQGAVAEVKGEGLIKSTGRMYRQDYVVFLRAADGKIAFLREYFDPVRAAEALDTPILGLESWFALTNSRTVGYSSIATIGLRHPPDDVRRQKECKVRIARHSTANRDRRCAAALGMKRPFSSRERLIVSTISLVSLRSPSPRPKKGGR
jgi:hypothetical protein